MELFRVDTALQKELPENKPDGSGLGINFIEAVIKRLPKSLGDGQAFKVKRRGLKLTVSLGDKKAESLLRYESAPGNGVQIFFLAFQEALGTLGVELIHNDGLFSVGSSASHN